MSRVFEVPEEDLEENSSTNTIENWDSLNHMKLVLALEDEFGVQFEEAETLEMQSFKLIKFVLSRYLDRV